MSAPAKIDGPALREVTVRDYKRNAERAGLNVDSAAIEALALADCNTYAAVLRDDTPSLPAAPDPEKEAEKAGALEREIAEKAGATLLDEPVQSVPIPLLAGQNAPDSKWAAATSRCAAICRGGDPLAFARPGASTTETMRAITSTCEMPELAMEIERIKAHWGIYMLTGGRGTGRVMEEPNIFAGLRMEDALRKYRRRIEDICDRSEGKLGSWWTRRVTYGGRPT